MSYVALSGLLRDGCYCEVDLNVNIRWNKATDHILEGQFG